MTTVSLVLGSGGARGYAHIGVIQALESRGYKINCIAGSSMGSLIGGVYAAGALDEYTRWVRKLSRFNVIALLDITFKMGAIRGDKLFGRLREMIGDPNIEDLSIPYTAVATDLVHQKEVWFQRGSLQSAIRASIAIPGVFTPVIERNRILVDGGVLNPLPIIPVVAAHSDLIIAVDLNAQKQVPHFEVPQPSCWLDHPISDYAMDEINCQEPEPVKPKFDGNIDLVMGAVEVMQGALSQYKIAGYPPDLLISVPAETCRFHDFHRANDVIDVGFECANDALNQIERL
jgi:NTE family protein